VLFTILCWLEHILVRHSKKTAMAVCVFWSVFACVCLCVIAVRHDFLIVRYGSMLPLFPRRVSENTFFYHLVEKVGGEGCQ
jgi:hypothetical protein